MPVVTNIGIRNQSCGLLATRNTCFRLYWERFHVNCCHAIFMSVHTVFLLDVFISQTSAFLLQFKIGESYLLHNHNRCKGWKWVCCDSSGYIYYLNIAEHVTMMMARRHVRRTLWHVWFTCVFSDKKAKYVGRWLIIGTWYYYAPTMNMEYITTLCSQEQIITVHNISLKI